ncbi:MAG: GntR family transcriptional regulator [Candidatus Competibacteraceae bacterium]|nr:GntR family transcriptional regulator [Candidatus Competibacteraceae bacterium]
MKKQSATEQAYSVIKKNILSHKLAPGTRLTSRNMARLTGVSVIPVLHALQRLDGEGLIETIPGWGSRVITLDQETVRDKYYLREAIECQVVRILAMTITEPQVEELARLVATLDEYGSAYPVDDRYWPTDHEFHLTLARFAGSKSLLREIQKINLFRFLQRAKEWTLVEKEAFPKDHHKAVLDAILSGDPDAAEKAMRAHIHHRSHRVFNHVVRRQALDRN